MRKFTFMKKAVGCFILLLSHTLFAQQVYVETTQTLPGNPVKSQSIFNKDGYTQILDENNQKVYIANNALSSNENVTTGEENIDEVTLTIEKVYDPNLFYTNDAVTVFNDEGFKDFAWYNEASNSYIITLAPGTYNLATNFRGIQNSDERDRFVIKELVEVQGNITVEMNVAEADNYIATKLYDETGEELIPGIVNPDNTVTGGNADILVTRNIYFNPSGFDFYGFTFYLEYLYPEAQDPIWNFYISDISDRYSVIQSLVAKGYEGENYFPKYETLTDISSNVSLENDPEDYILHKEKLRPGPMAEAQTPVYGFETEVTINNSYSAGWRVWDITENAEEGLITYLNNPIDGDRADLLVFPVVMELWEEGLNPIFTAGNAIVKGDNNDVLYGSGNTFFAPNSNFQGIFHYGAEGEVFKILPFHPQFSFTSNNNSEIIQGDNTPISVITPIIVPPAEINFLEVQYKGRYGERRENDLYYTNIEAKQDGNIFFSGNYLEFLQLNPFPSPGMWDITFTNTNIEVDGLPGKNITKVIYNGSEGDSAPVLQHLQFRNTDDQVTDRFTSATEGTVRLAAGDFQYNLDNGYYDYVEGNAVEFYYSLYDQENWTELELTKYDEFFQMPAFGDYYEASLASVAVPQDNSWFDVRIICTDAAGNKQEQVISPAFKIEQATMGIIEEIDKSGFAVYPNPFTNQLNIELSENVKGDYTFKISDLTGKTIYTQNRNDKSFAWNGSSLPQGIYILSIETNGKVMAKKVIRK